MGDFQVARRKVHGFTVVELIIVLAVLSISLAAIVPPLQQLVHREQILGLTRETKQLITRTRFEAVKRGVPTVVSLDTDTNEVFAFADIHGVALSDPSDGLFNPDTSGALRRTDYEIGRFQLRAGIEWRNPDDDLGLDSVDGFDNSGDPDPPDQQIIFSSTGEANSAGAFRFADPRGNFLEIRILQAGTARLAVRKWDGSDWLEQGQGGKSWEWR